MVWLSGCGVWVAVLPRSCAVYVLGVGGVLGSRGVGGGPVSTVGFCTQPHAGGLSRLAFEALPPELAVPTQTRHNRFPSSLFVVQPRRECPCRLVGWVGWMDECGLRVGVWVASARQ